MSLLGSGLALAQGAAAGEGEAAPEEEALPLEIRITTAPGSVLLKTNREITLNTGAYLLAPGGEDFDERREASITPFKFKVEEVVEEVLEDTGESVEDTPEAIRYSEQEILGLVASGLQRQITGTMIMGDRRILLRSNGKPLRIGDSFGTRVSSDDPTTYTIRITGIQQKTFSIALNDTEVVVPIGEPLGGSSITPGQ